MPFVVRSDSENEAELVFLSPDEEVRPAKTQVDQGGSPVLRRSNRKRKSTAAYSDSEMSKNSGSKKKKGSSSPDPGKSMPKIPRTPQQGQENTPEQAPKAKTPAVPEVQRQPMDFERLLAGMEERLASKIESNNRAVGEAVALAKQTQESLCVLEEEVKSKDAALRAALEDCETRIMRTFQTTVKDMVQDQLREAGFDPDLTAGALSTRRDISLEPSRIESTSYASVTAKPGTTKLSGASLDTQADRREERFWQCRRSLRLWPVPGGDLAGLKDFLRTKLRMDEQFIEEELGEVHIKKHKDLRAKTKDEVFVQFDTKEVRDTVKAQASNLANFRDEAGMRLHLPNHLQKDFKALMALSYDLKKRNPDLKRNVKFDEDDLGLFMDVQFKRDGQWKRVKPEHARRALEASGTSSRKGGPDSLKEDELVVLLAGPDGQESQDE